MSYWRPYQNRVLFNPENYSLQTYRGTSHPTNQLYPEKAKQYLEFLIMNNDPGLKEYVSKFKTKSLDINMMKYTLLDADDPTGKPFAEPYWMYQSNSTTNLQVKEFKSFEETCTINMVQTTGGIVFPFWIIFFVYPSTIEKDDVLLCASLIYTRDLTEVTLNPKEIYEEFLPEDAGKYSLCNLTFPLSKDELIYPNSIIPARLSCINQEPDGSGLTEVFVDETTEGLKYDQPTPHDGYFVFPPVCITNKLIKDDFVDYITTVIGK